MVTSQALTGKFLIYKANLIMNFMSGTECGKLLVIRGPSFTALFLRRTTILSDVTICMH